MHAPTDCQCNYLPLQPHNFVYDANVKLRMKKVKLHFVTPDKVTPGTLPQVPAIGDMVLLPSRTGELVWMLVRWRGWAGDSVLVGAALPDDPPPPPPPPPPN